MGAPHTDAVRTRLVPVAAGLLAGVLTATPVAAHPFGPPPTARITAQGRTVTVEWSATPDDAVAIGERLGIMPPGSVAAYRQEAAAQVAPSGQDEARLSASPRLAEYLTERITVAQDGRPCDATTAPIPDFVHAGARVVATCPARIQEVTLSITMLHDINDAYRTVGIGTQSDPPQGVFTVAAPEQVWRFGATEQAGGSPPVLAAIGGGVLVAAVACVVALRRRRRSG